MTKFIIANLFWTKPYYFSIIKCETALPTECRKCYSEKFTRIYLLLLSLSLKTGTTIPFFKEKENILKRRLVENDEQTKKEHALVKAGEIITIS